MAWENNPMRERIAGAIMRAFFSRPVDEQQMNVSMNDQLDLADGVLQELRKPPERVLRQLEDLMDDQGHFHTVRDSWEMLIDALMVA